MALSLYLDDCANSNLLAQLLTQAGHTVIRPADAGTAWEADDVQSSRPEAASSSTRPVARPWVGRYSANWSVGPARWGHEDALW